jgi:uncharacterized membrane protein YwaF
MQTYLGSKTILDQVSPYLLGPLLIISAILMFLRKSKSIVFFPWYIILSTGLALVHILSTLRFEFNGLRGVLVVSAGLLLSLGIHPCLVNIN